MKRWMKNCVLFSLLALASGCSGTTEEVAPVTEKGPEATEAENKARMEKSMEMGGRGPTEEAK